MQSRQINADGLALIKAYEGLQLRAYRCPAGVPTIGYGHTQGITQRDVERRLTCSVEQAQRWLVEDLDHVQVAVMDMVTVPLRANQFAALVSWAFNIGVRAARGSTLVRRLNGGDYKCVPEQLARWCHADGRVLVGLQRRRRDEADLWSTAVGMAPRRDGRGLLLGDIARAVTVRDPAADESSEEVA